MEDVRVDFEMSLKDRKHRGSVNFFFGVQSVADVVRRGRLRWFGHLERRSVDDWVSACRTTGGGI